MAFNISSSPVNVSSGTFYDPLNEFIKAQAFLPGGSASYGGSFMAPGSTQNAYNMLQYSPIAQQMNLEQQKLQMAQQTQAALLKALKGSSGGSTGMGGSGLPGAGGGFGDFDLSSFLNLFDVSDERARTGLRDQFTAAGGVENLPGPWSDSSAQLERGLGLQRGGHIVDLISRLTAPRISAQSQNLQTLVTMLARLLGNA